MINSGLAQKVVLLFIVVLFEFSVRLLSVF